MQMMIVLKPIAFDVIICMTQLFDYYLYSVNIDAAFCAFISFMYTMCVISVFFFHYVIIIAAFDVLFIDIR